MGNDIEIRVRVANNTATGLAAVNRSLSNLRDEARDAGRGLDGLTTRAAAASLALRGLKDSAQDASRALRSLNTAARNADGRLSTMSDRSRTLRRDTDDLDGSMRRLTTTMGGLRGSSGTLRTSFGNSGDGMQRLKAAAIALSPALIPVAASLVPIAAQAGAAGIAIGVFGAAMLGQLAAVKNAADAEQKYQEAVKKHGPASQQAAQAEALFLDQVQGMDPATRKAAASLGVLKDQYKQWSKSLAGDTMPVVTKGMAVLGALMPKLTPVVKGASVEMGRFMTILAGGVNSSGFSKFMESFAKFSTGVLSKANDGLVRFMRSMSGGAGSSQLTEFMAYAQRVGPAVGETLLNLSKGLIHLVAAASETGVSMLTLINAFAKLVNAIPTSLLSNLLQVYAAFKLIKLAGAGIGSVSGGFATLSTRLTALRAASTAAGGGIAGLRAAFASLSTGAKIGLAAGAVGALVLVLHKLSDNKPAVEVDALSTSLNTLLSTGKMTGALASNFDEISASIAMVSKGASDNAIAGMVSDFGSWIGIAKGPGISTAKKNVDAWDKSMANLVRSGHVKEAKAQYELLKRSWAAGGGDMSRLKKFTDDYRGALADQAFEQKMAAESMGLFGQAALDAQAKLDAQKSSADGLRQSIQALNDVNRQGLGGMIGFEAAIDAAAKAAKDNAGALSMTNGVLNLGSEKARNAAGALQDLADKTDSAAASARESGSSWETVNGIYSRGRDELIKQAHAMGLSKEQAAQLADQILKIPDKTSKVKMNTEDAKADLNAFNAAVKRSPGSKSVTLKTLSKSAEAILESFGYKVKRLPNGKVTVSAKTGAALSGIRNVAGAIAALHSKSVTITTNRVTKFTSVQGGVTVAKRDYARGGKVRGYAGGGDVQAYPDGGFIQGPGSGTSDSILTMLGSGNVVRSSNTEFIVNARQTAKHRRLLELINSDQLPRFAKGGLTKKQKAAKAQADAERQARHDAMPDLTISHFGQMAGYQRSEFRSGLAKPDSLGSLVDSLNQWRHMIEKMTHGATESKLLKALDGAGRKLLTYEKQLNSVNKSLEKAKDKLNSLKDAAAQLSSSIKSSVMGSGSVVNAAQGSAGFSGVGGILSGMRASTAQAQQFAAMLDALKKRGLNAQSIAEIAQAGIEGGGFDTAQRLMGASSGDIQQINTLEKQLTTAAGAAGKTTADAMYGTMIKLQTKLVNDLKVQQEKLTKAMDNLAKAMEKMIEKAIGKKAAGGIVGAAASGGIRGGLTLVGEHGPELADLPVGARVWSNPDSRRKAAPPWASMLNMPKGRAGAVRRAATPVAGGGDGVVQVNLVLDGKVVARALIDPIRGEVQRIGGGSVQKAFGRGNG